MQLVKVFVKTIFLISWVTKFALEICNTMKLFFGLTIVNEIIGLKFELQNRDN